MLLFLGQHLTNLLPDVVAKGHVWVEFATVEKVGLRKLPSQDAAFDQVYARDVRDIPEAAEKLEGEEREHQD